MSNKETVLIIPDLQAPFEHKDALDFVSAVADKYQPTKVVNIGDEIDFHRLTDYEHDPDGFSAGHELRKAIRHMQPWYDKFPRTKVCISNHTSRPFRQAYRYGIPRALMRDYNEFLQAPDGWKWKDFWIVDGVRYEHGHQLGGGYGKTLASRAAQKNGRSTVYGHFHASAGIHWTSTPEQLVFAFNVGCLIDWKAYAFAYAKGAKERPILGCGVVQEGIPTFIPMLLRKGGRWVKRLIG